MVGLDVVEIANIWWYKLENKHDVISFSQIYLLKLNTGIFFFLLLLYFLKENPHIVWFPNIIDFGKLNSSNVIRWIVNIRIVVFFRELMLLIKILVLVYTDFWLQSSIDESILFLIHKRVVIYFCPADSSFGVNSQAFIYKISGIICNVNSIKIWSIVLNFL